MTIARHHRHSHGFSLIEAILMIAAIAIFTVLLYGVLKKDYLSSPPPPSANGQPKPPTPPEKTDRS